MLGYAEREYLKQLVMKDLETSETKEFGEHILKSLEKNFYEQLVREDVEQVAENMEVTLTEDELNLVVHRAYNYDDSDYIAFIQDTIERVLD